MRYILLATAAVALIAVFDKPEIRGNGSGRGNIHPPLVSQADQINCLATMVYGEARSESYTGQVAVAHTAMNRAVKRSLCDVVLAPKQYSVFNNNPGLRAAAMSTLSEPNHKNSIEQAGWAKAKLVAHDVYSGKTKDPTNGATFYVADKVMKSKKYRYPKWTKQYEVVAVIENHRFFKPVDKKSI